MDIFEFYRWQLEGSRNTSRTGRLSNSSGRSRDWIKTKSPEAIALQGGALRTGIGSDMAPTLQAYEGNLIFEREGKKHPQRYLVAAKSELEAKEYFREKFKTEKMIIEGIQTISTPQELQKG